MDFKSDNLSVPQDILNSIDESGRKEKLNILIFGPGPSGGSIYKKRCEIKDKINELGHSAHFGEDVCTPDILQSSGLNLSVAEYIAVKQYDYIVCLMVSPGSIGEVHDFARDPKIAHKMTICIDLKHKDSYGAKGVIRIFEGRHGRVDWFKSPKDIKNCHLLTRILEQIMKVAEARQWEKATDRSKS